MKSFAVCACAVLAIFTNVSFAQDASGSASAGKTTESGGPPHPAKTQSQEENWTELNAAKSGLYKSRIKAWVLGKSDFPDYTSELVRVEWREGDPVDLYVLRPHGIAKPPVVLYLYGFPSDDYRFKQETWGKSVTKGGFAAVGFVSALTGQRYNMRPMREWFVSELQESLGSSVHDVQMILDYLTMRGDVDTTHAAMLGEGSGGTIAILAAAADSRIGFVDALNPWGDWPEWLKESQVIPEKERANYLKPEFLTKVARLDPIAYLPQLDAKRIRIEQVVGDMATPKSVQVKFSVGAPAASVIQYEDTKAEIQAWTKQNWWIKTQLHPSPSPSTKAPTE